MYGYTNNLLKNSRYQWLKIIPFNDNFLKKMHQKVVINFVSNLLGLVINGKTCSAMFVLATPIQRISIHSVTSKFESITD